MKEVNLLPRKTRQSEVPELLVRLGDPDGDVSWRLDGRCAEIGPDLFFPEKGEDTTTARWVCAGCEVRLRCLEYAIQTREEFGIWGGTTEREREQIRRLRNGQEAAA
ncbi:WhiB family transcriptional regulator [Amycolatopsis rhabdoformis]|uniref:Transcriptional regulator WhiB n=1 Tax=Amycolatopsis rhabdoformis TaxID=1448059 RepID=A0ABZ1HWZ9_9PSEU|nr:WhiB family transcriptional regulator [Amycolatopsis rhabdoformis]WSE26136.1 WhiB family transcriptional regulator [Amycolatopsis rhabdoformis]